jgi:glutathione S-transferase
MALKLFELVGAESNRPFSPYCWRIRMALAHKGLDAELVPWRFLEKAAVEPTGQGKVPVLVTDDGAAVFDSRVIVEFLDTVSPISRLIPPSGRSRVEVRCWEALADGLLDAALLIRMEQTQRPENLRSASWVARQTGKIDSALAAISNGLADKPYCAEGKYTLADIAVGCALGYLDFRFAEIDWRARHANLARHAEKLFARQTFIDTAPPTA